MQPPVHSIHSLFEQLGLNGSDEAIEAFISKNSPIPSTLELHNASFWNVSQSSLLQEMVEEDADWAEVVDQLDTRLR